MNYIINKFIKKTDGFIMSTIKPEPHPDKLRREKLKEEKRKAKREEKRREEKREREEKEKREP